MRGAIPPLPQYAFMALCLVKQRNNFTFNVRHSLHATKYCEQLLFQLMWILYRRFLCLLHLQGEAGDNKDLRSVDAAAYFCEVPSPKTGFILGLNRCETSKTSFS
jgi:hypothetical protein